MNQTNKVNMEWSTKIVNFMTPRAGVVLRHGHKSYIEKCIISLKIFFSTPVHGYIVMMTNEGSTKYKSHIEYALYLLYPYTCTAHWLLLCYRVMMLLSSAIVARFLVLVFSWSSSEPFWLSFGPLSVGLCVNFSHFQLLFQNHWVNFIQTWQKASLGVQVCSNEGPAIFQREITDISKKQNTLTLFKNHHLWTELLDQYSNQTWCNAFLDEGDSIFLKNKGPLYFQNRDNDFLSLNAIA